MADVQCRS